MKPEDVLSAEPSRKKRKRVGRGIGSGRGKTCTRGTKGYGSRSGASGKLGHEGGTMPLYRRLPRRGFNNSRFRTEYTAINVGELDARFEGGEVVDMASLLQRGMIKKSAKRLKLLGNGEISKALTIKADAASKSARAKIEAASGSLELPQNAETNKK